MRKKVIKISDLYLIAEFIYVFGCVYSQTNFSINIINIFVDLMQYMSIPLLLIKMICENRMNTRRLLISSIVSILVIAISLVSQNFTILLPIVLFIVAKGKITDDEVIKCGMIAVSIVTLATILLAFAGVIDMGIGHSFDGRMRNGLGFQYFTYPANYFFHITIMYVFLKKKYISIPETVCILGINSVLYYFTQTKAVYYEIVLLIVLCWLVRFFKIAVNKKLRIWVTGSFIISAIAVILLAWYYDASKIWMYAVNALTSYRLSLAHQGLMNYGFSMFGNNIQFNSFLSTSAYDYVDSSYINILLQYGVVGLM